MPRQRLQLVENGVVKRLATRAPRAAKMKSHQNIKTKVGPIAPTGHGFLFPMKWEKRR